jgi:hypothetical protein
MKAYRISEIAYALIALIASDEAFSLWNINPSKAQMFVGFAVLSVFMFFFRRHYRKKFSNRSKDSQ